MKAIVKALTPNRRRLQLSVLGAIGALLALGAVAAAATGASGVAATATVVKAVAVVPQQLDMVNRYEGDPSADLGFEQAGTLLTYDAAKLKGGGCLQLPNLLTGLKGELSSGVKISPDRHTITFQLRKAVSPFGNTMTAEDVKWSLDRAVALSSIVRFLFFSVSKFEARNTFVVVSPTKLQVRVATPTVFDLAVFTWGQTQIVDSTEAKKHATDKDPWAIDWLSKQTAGFGPFYIKPDDFQPGVQATLSMNPRYTGPHGNVAKLIVRAIPEASVRAQLLQSGQVDFAARLTLDEYAQLKNAKGVRIDSCLGFIRDTLLLQIADKRFADPRVRQAISLGIDRKAIVKGVYHGFGLPAMTGIHQGYGVEGLNDYITYDPAKAKQLLAAAGATNLSFTLTVSPARPGPYAEQIANFIKSQLSKIGVNVDIKVVGNEYSTIFFGGQYEGMLYSESPAFGSPIYSLLLMNASSSFQDSFHYKNAAYDNLVASGTGLAATKQRDKLLRLITNVMAKDPPEAYLVDTIAPQAWSTKVSGYQSRGNVNIVNPVTLTKQG